jgi:succinyl-CoA synthetase beta subunit
MPNQLRKIGFNLELTGQAFKNMLFFSSSLYNAFIKTDASLLEINPVLKTSDSKILAVDSKMIIDDNSMIRHKDFEQLRDLSEENPIETEAKEVGLNYVDLDGNIGCMVNGAGLAMATMDLIKQSGGEPANFLDVGGTADSKRVEIAFNLILKDPKVKAVLVNIFGGIVRCDRVANGIVGAYRNMGDKINVPIIVRLQGTNSDEAKKIIDNSGLKIYSAIDFNEVPQIIKKLL